LGRERERERQREREREREREGGREGSKIKLEEGEEGGGAATAAEEQLKAIPLGCISLLRALRPRVLIKIDLRLRRPATTGSYCSCCFLEIRSAGDYTEDEFRT